MLTTVDVLIPCYNEELTISETIREFAEQTRSISETKYAFNFVIVDNASTDQTASIAKRALSDNDVPGFIVSEPRKGKGQAVRTGFQHCSADIVVMVDGDTTYPAAPLETLLDEMLIQNADMVVGDRLSSGGYTQQNTRDFHDFGNKSLAILVSKLFEFNVSDVLSGYRTFSRSFVETYPAMSQGFELEIDLTLHTLDKRLYLAEVPVGYRSRPSGSESKLNTFTDGFRVINSFIRAVRLYKPLFFYGIISGLFLASGLIFGFFPVFEFFQTSVITKFPLALLAVGLVLLSGLFLSVALVLDSVSRLSKRDFELKFANLKRQQLSKRV